MLFSPMWPAFRDKSEAREKDEILVDILMPRSAEVG